MDSPDQVEKLHRAGSQDSGLKPTEWMLLAGATVGPYQIEGPLGRGGMGQVYRARDTRLGRPVALKFLFDSTVTNAEVLERFRREAQAISTLNHPNVCTVYDIGEQAGRPYLVMELMEGQTLKERNAAGPCTNEEIRSIAIAILNALDAASACGIVHRDIKPANIFLTCRGSVKILDFGLAKSAGAPRGVEDSLTTPGTTVGTVSYMSPEQARGEAVDARSDLFACGAVLYEMATGTLPFAADGWAATMAAVLTRAPRPARELRRDLAPEIDHAIERVLEKDPAARYQSAADMRAALERGWSSPALPAGPIRKGRRTMYGIAGAALLAIAGGGWYFGARNRPVTSTSEYVQLTDFAGSTSAPALSPDGRMVVFFEGGESFLTTSQIYAKVLPNGQATQLTNDPQRKYGPVFTADGSRVAYSVLEADDEWSVWTVPVTGGASTRVMRNAAGPQWIGDGRLLFSEVMNGTALHMGIVTAQESRAGEREIYFPDHERAMAHFSYLSPDGKSVLVVEMDGAAVWQRCRLVPMDGSSKGAQVGPEGACVAAGWSPDGKWMYFNAQVNGGSHLWRERYPDGAAEQITFGPGEEEGLAVDGKSLISSVGVRKSSVWIHDGSGERSLPVEGSATAPKVSADGKRVFYLLRKATSAGSELWSAEWTSGKSNAALPGVAMMDYDVSADGQQVVFTSQAGTETRIFVAPLDGSAGPRQIARGGDTVSFGAPGEVVFRQFGQQSNYLARVKTDGTGLARVVERPIADKLAVSPNGEWAVVSEYGTYLVSLRDGTRKNICGGSLCLVHWPAAGGFIYLTINPSWTNGGSTVALPVRRGEWVPDLPASGVSIDADGKVAGSTVIHSSELAPGADLRTFAFVKFEFVGNLFRIPLH